MPLSKRKLKKAVKVYHKSVRKVFGGGSRRAKGVLGPFNPMSYQPLNVRPLSLLRAPRNFLGESRRVTLEYAESFVLQSQTLLSAMGTPQYFSLNDLFDPNYTGSGHQPRGFDQLTVMFQKYRVFRARAKFYFQLPTTDTAWCGYHLLNSQQAVYTAGTSFDYVNEVPGNIIQKLPKDTQLCFFDSGWVPIWQLEGLSYGSWKGDDGFDANWNASPAAISKLGVFVGDWAAPAGVTSVTCVMRIEYDALFYSAKTVTTS